MKKLKVIIKDKNTLVLEENGEKGDYIDLSSLNSIDTLTLENEIRNGKDQMYHKMLEEALKQKESEYNVKLQSELLKVKNDNDQKINNLTNNKDKEISDLKRQLKIFESTKEADLNNALLKQKEDLMKEVNELKAHIQTLTKTQETEIINTKLTVEKEYQEKINNLEKKLNDKEIEKVNSINKINDDMNKKIAERDEEINKLTYQKSIVNVKQTGENLESWCNNEVTSYMQNGLSNCTWTKDNTVVKNEEDVKGSKADFLFNIYLTDEHKDEDLLTSLCLEMKDENPSSTYKKKNSDYYEALDKNRRKKNAKYAVLVSNLELDKNNDLPIRKINEYENMYLVRPSYLMTFINMVVSLTNQFRNVILTNQNKELEIKNKQEFLDEFDKIKNTYLDKPLETLSNRIDKISSNNENIIKAANNISETINYIKSSYLAEIENKISKFELKIDKAYKKLS